MPGAGAGRLGALPGAAASSAPGPLGRRRPVAGVWNAAALGDKEGNVMNKEGFSFPIEAPPLVVPAPHVFYGMTTKKRTEGLQLQLVRLFSCPCSPRVFC